jgi:pimeloyl-ACP methyl ester carboxylesterase
VANHTQVGPTAEHTVRSIECGTSGPDVVCLPGYGAGAAFFYRNMSGLEGRTKLHLVDWLGTGTSGRPPFRCKNREDTEDWFIESFESWRKSQGVEKMVLVGHSLGGYLAANYSLRYPERVSHLVLVCPAGMVRPFSITSRWFFLERIAGDRKGSYAQCPRRQLCRHRNRQIMSLQSSSGPCSPSLAWFTAQRLQHGMRV